MCSRNDDPSALAASATDEVPQPTPQEERDAVLAERLDWEAEQERAASATDEGPRYVSADEVNAVLDSMPGGRPPGIVVLPQDARPAVPALDASAFVDTLTRFADRAHDNESYRTLVPEHVLRDAAAVIEDLRYQRAASATDEPDDFGTVWHETRATVTSDGETTHYVTARPAVPALDVERTHCPGCDGSHT